MRLFPLSLGYPSPPLPQFCFHRPGFAAMSPLCRSDCSPCSLPSLLSAVCWASAQEQPDFNQDCAGKALSSPRKLLDITSIQGSFTTLGNEAELKIPYVPLTLPIHCYKWLEFRWLQNKTCFMFLLLSEAVHKAFCHLVEYPSVLQKRITKFIRKRQRSLQLVFLSFSLMNEERSWNVWSQEWNWLNFLGYEKIQWGIYWVCPPEHHLWLAIQCTG